MLGCSLRGIDVRQSDEGRVMSMHSNRYGRGVPRARALAALLVAALMVLLAGCCQKLVPGASGCGYDTGSQVEVLWNGHYYKAAVIETRASECKVHYTGWASSYDEWATSARMRADHDLAIGEPIEVEWKGKYWPAVVRAKRPNEWRVHYDGYEDSWDEWVGARRIRYR
jgi:hypothetical protein